VLDVMLPGIDGFETCRRLRRDGIWAPVLMLTARGATDDRVAGLDGGADDYMVKPFAFAELLARVEALLRRASGDVQHVGVLRIADLELNVLARRVTRGGKEIDLTAKEFQLLEYLMRRIGQVITRTMLLENVWNLHFDPQTNLIDVHISRLRQAIDKGYEHPLLHTIRGAGYTIRLQE
jgi:two-component system OmpR family response regulator